MYCTTDPCLTVNKLKKEKREQCWCTDVSVHVVYILSTVETEDTYTRARPGALLSSSQPSVPPLQAPVAHHDSFIHCSDIPVTLWRVTVSPAQSESPRFWTVLDRHVWFETKTTVVRTFKNCFTARLLSVVGLRTCADSCCVANCMSGLHSASQKLRLIAVCLRLLLHILNTSCQLRCATIVSSRTDLYSRYQLEASAAIARLVIQVNGCWCRLVDEDMLEAVR